MITARNLTKKFGDISALTDLTISIGPGEFVFLTGPSGSGKTTLLRLAMRDLLPDSGSLIVNTHDLAKLKKKDLPALRREIGTVFQDFKLLADRNIWENVSLPLEVRRLPQSQIDKAVKIALELVGLANRATLFPAQLSGGELQRAGLARAIVGKPKMILADEPTGNLDPKTARVIVKLLKDIHAELKTTVVMATHNADIVNLYSHRVISLDKGKLIKDNPKGKYE
ncbi:MAG: cell division transport system ATP-binding protein [Microgenomates group bacterium Gr01-1014_16]|nr:MAG: cell division transport system ATP-binding protein [Microgenomates group bacterium Gr01-1014_16]